MSVCDCVCLSCRLYADSDAAPHWLLPERATSRMTEAELLSLSHSSRSARVLVSYKEQVRKLVTDRQTDGEKRLTCVLREKDTDGSDSDDSETDSRQQQRQRPAAATAATSITQ